MEVDKSPISIYRLNFVNGKSYIGQTQRMGPRISSHRASVGRRDLPIYRAWEKHGEPSIEVLAVVEQHMADFLEARCIIEYGTLLPHGYNVLFGATARGYKWTAKQRLAMEEFYKNNPLSEETKKKMSLAKTGKSRTFSDTHKENIGKAFKGKKKGPLPEETRLKMSLAKRGKSVSAETKIKISNGHLRRKLVLTKLEM